MAKIMKQKSKFYSDHPGRSVLSDSQSSTFCLFSIYLLFIVHLHSFKKYSFIKHHRENISVTALK